MSEFFLKILNMSIAAGWLAAAVMLLRPLLCKAPKFWRCLLWGLVAVRLICPFSVKSIASLLPSAESVPQDILYSPAPAVQSGIPALNTAINPILSGSLAPVPGNSINPMQVVICIAALVWVCGAAALLLYTAVAWLRIRKKVRESVPLKDHVRLSEQVDSPFVFGLIRPRIYLPANIDETAIPHVLAHEHAHLRRGDHWWKLLGFLLLSVYWFHPLLWVAYLLFCRDTEFAADEKVLRDMSGDDKRAYSAALLACSSPRRLAAFPPAFGETGVRARIRAALNYKKPSFWLSAAAVVVLLAVAVCFLTDPMGRKTTRLPEDPSAQGTVFFYDKSTSEHEIPAMARYATFSEKELDALLKLLAEETWVNDYLVDRTSHYYDGQLCYKGWICFSYSQNIVYYDHYFCEVENEVLQYFHDLQAISKPYLDTFTADNTLFGELSHSYTYTSAHDNAYLTLMPETKQFSFSMSLLSSYWPRGSYREDGDFVILETDDGKNTYVFKRMSEHLRFLANHSSPVPQYRYDADDKSPTPCIPDNAVFCFTETTRTSIGQVLHDIDLDGEEELCVLGYGPTSGLFTFTMSVYEKSSQALKYFDIFLSDPRTFSFELSENDQLYLIGKTSSTPPALLRYEIHVQDGHVTLSNGGETVPYWSSGGIDSPYAPKKDS